MPETTADVQPPSGGAIHIELPGQVMISGEGGADRALLRCVVVRKLPSQYHSPHRSSNGWQGR
jgi:hypothetical protein